MFTTNAKSLSDKQIKWKQKTSLDYRNVFSDAGIAFWEKDASLLKTALSKLIKSGVTDFKAYFKEDTKLFEKFVGKIHIVTVNNETLKLYRITNRKILENGLAQFFYRDSYSKFLDALIALFNGASEYEYTSKKITVNGDYIITKVKIKVPQEFKNCWTRWIVTEHDVSELYATEKRKIIELQKAVENRDKLISIIAHDLKNPFNNILGFSSLLSDKFDQLGTERVKTFLEYINDSATQSFNLLSNLLNWARTQNAQTDFYPEKINLRKIVDENILFSAGSCRKKNITITSNIPDNIVLCTDVNMIHFVLRNILTNAIKFSYRNSEIVLCGNRKNDFYEMRIKDNGIGISPTDITSIFANNKPSKKGTENEHGTGLGLSMCYDFINKMNGEIAVESTLGEGSCFIISLPVTKL